MPSILIDELYELIVALSTEKIKKLSLIDRFIIFSRIPAVIKLFFV